MGADREPGEPEAQAEPSRGRRLARLVTEVLAPAPVSVVALVVVVLRSASSPGEALRWLGIGVLFATLIPLAYIVRGVRRREITDHHVRRREQRLLPLLVGILSVAVLLALFVLLRAPHELFALVGTMVTGLVVSLLVTLVWKISVHVGVVAGTIVILAVLFGPVLLLLAPLVVLVAWARVELGDHTVAQVIAGGLLGGAVAAVAFSLLR